MTDEAYDAREHYTKYEYRIPMRDGVKLFTSVLVPKDASTAYPFLIVRSPFGVGPYGPDEYPPSSDAINAFFAPQTA
jgi:predicted acyl esterase